MNAPVQIQSRASAPPPLIGDFARDTYLGACAVADLLAVIERPDRALQLVAELYLRMMHDTPYAVADARQVLPMEAEERLILIARLMRQGLVRRAGGVAPDLPLQDHHRIEIAPAWKAELSGFFARATLRGPAALEDWARCFG